MTDILRTTPEDRRRMDREARMLTRRCDGCGVGFRRSNLLPLRDGRHVCSGCLDEIMAEAAAAR